LHWNLRFSAGHGWRETTQSNLTGWFSGYLVVDGRTLEGDAAFAALDQLLPRPWDLHRCGQILRDLDGSFAFALESPDAVLASVDWLRSIPLFYSHDENSKTLEISSNANDTVTAIGLIEPDVSGSLSLAMSGYASGDRTLYRDLKQMPAGVCMLVSRDGVKSEKYYAYEPWRVVRNYDPDRFSRDLEDVTLAIMEKTIAGLEGRPVMLPISAGLDSRLIASAFRHLGYDNVICYSYGQPGNSDAEVGRMLAEKLGYPWHFSEYSREQVKTFHQSETFRRFMAYADSCASVHFIQDNLAIYDLKTRSLAPDDAVFINGNSGDYISGGHIHASMMESLPGATWPARKQRIVDCLIDKHYSLWRDLRSTDYNAQISEELLGILDTAIPHDPGPDKDYGVYETLECQERQAKYVVSGQRTYEFYGHGWRLPLWDVAYRDFWEGVPLSLKQNQRLYRDMLTRCNWAGVWSTIPVNRKRVNPAWMRPIRLAAKAFAAPFGRDRWHRLEKRVFDYWIDPLNAYAAYPYGRMLFDRRGLRNVISLRCEAYLAAKGRSADGTLEIARTL
jgi:asparagine synthase (glutamine-hydrolysing)